MELSERYLASVIIVSEAGNRLAEGLGLLPTDKSLRLKYIEILDSLAQLSVKLLQKGLEEEVKSGREIPSEIKKLVTELKKKLKQIVEKHKVRM